MSHSKVYQKRQSIIPLDVEEVSGDPSQAQVWFTLGLALLSTTLTLISHSKHRVQFCLENNNKEYV